MARWLLLMKKPKVNNLKSLSKYSGLLEALGLATFSKVLTA
jgi:hypothetical protein